MRVALTMQAGRLEPLAEALAAHGLEPVAAPLIETRPRSEARAEAAALLALPWLLVTSRSTVEAWAALGLAWDGPRVGAVGDATAAALRAARADVALVAETPTGAGLAAAFLARPDARGPVGLPQGSRARPELRDALEAAGVATRPVTVYDTTARAWDGGEVGAVVLASPSAVAALPERIARAARLVALGPTTAEAARARGWSCAAAPTPDADGVLAALAPQGEPTGGPA